jgi:hypothetical protein
MVKPAKLFKNIIKLNCGLFNEFDHGENSQIFKKI